MASGDALPLHDDGDLLYGLGLLLLEAHGVERDQVVRDDYKVEVFAEAEGDEQDTLRLREVKLELLCVLVLHEQQFELGRCSLKRHTVLGRVDSDLQDLLTTQDENGYVAYNFSMKLIVKGILVSFLLCTTSSHAMK